MANDPEAEAAALLPWSQKVTKEQREQAEKILDDIYEERKVYIDDYTELACAYVAQTAALAAKQKEIDDLVIGVKHASDYAAKLESALAAAREERENWKRTAESHFEALELEVAHVKRLEAEREIPADAWLASEKKGRGMEYGFYLVVINMTLGAIGGLLYSIAIHLKRIADILDKK